MGDGEKLVGWMNGVEQMKNANYSSGCVILRFSCTMHLNYSQGCGGGYKWRLGGLIELLWYKFRCEKETWERRDTNVFIYLDRKPIRWPKST